MDALPKLTILTVDDSRSNLQLLQAFLKQLGHETIAAENGEAAVALYEAHQPDLVLMDIIMPVMGGLEASQRIRAYPSERWIPIIFLSALDRDENLVAGLEAGGDDYLTKPINFVVLEAKIRSMQRMLMLQQRASDSRRWLQTVSDNVLEAIVTIDTDGIITSCNRAVEDLFGWHANELIGENVSVLCPEPHRSEHDRYVREYVAGGPPKIIGSTREISARHCNGSLFTAEIRISEVRIERQRMFMAVIRDISERRRSEQLLQENALRLQRYYDATEAENRLAMSLIQRQLMREGLNDPLLSYWLSPARNFSGDVLAAGRSTAGRLYALLADATGHGLAAAISTVPVLTLFYRLLPENAPLASMVSEINQQLRDAMPVGHFVGATLVCIDPVTKSGEIWIGGMPAGFLLDRKGTVQREFRSRELPLGIVDSTEIEVRPEEFDWRDGDQLALYSDGLLEAEGAAGKPFGKNGLLAALTGATPCARKNAIEKALLAHLGGTPAEDDISLLLLTCPG